MSDNGQKERMPCKFKCLRCGFEYDGTFVKGLMEELSCPECESNSQRRLKEKKKAKAES